MVHSHRLALIVSLELAAMLLASAQPPTHGGTVVGTVYDSVQGVRLRGALVQLVGIRDSAHRGAASPPATVFSATADSDGAFQLRGIPRGRYFLGFQHELVRDLDVEERPVLLDIVSSSDVVSVDLATPSSQTIILDKCGSSAGHTGVIVGYITDVRGGVLSSTPRIVARWTELAASRLSLAAMSAVGQVSSSRGRYVLCGVVPSSHVMLEVSSAGYGAIAGEILVPDGGVAVQHLALPQSAAAVTVARLRGRVLNVEGELVPTGRASIANFALEVPIVAGHFAFPAVPLGTWPVQIRAIGFRPSTLLVAVRDDSTLTEVRLAPQAQSLDAVSVVGKRGWNADVLSGMESRRRVSGGTQFLPGNSWLATALTPSDVLRAARGFSYKSPKVVAVARDPSCRTGLNPALFGGPNAGRTRLELYLDGLPFAGDMEDLNNQVPVADVLAVEAYPDVMSAPPLWRTKTACAVIAVWTKR